MSAISELAYGITDSYYTLTHAQVFAIDPSVPHAPKRTPALTEADKKQAVRNALRYFPTDRHALLAKEFAFELETFGHIYMYRFRPTGYEMKAYPIGDYPAKCVQAAAIMLQIQNNLDKRVAQFPHELITYGGNGSVFNNWAQYHLTMKYLSQMSDQQTLVMYSGHPHGLFPSNKDAPRAIVTNGMVIPNYSSRQDYDKMYALGNSQFGQMTAGSYCYIGPQGIVHGTYHYGYECCEKPKAGVIAGVICVVAEVDGSALDKRFEQGWVMEKESDLEKVIERIKECKKNKICTSIGYHGNIVDLWESRKHLVDLGSDQTSLHNPFGGGYYPVSLGFAEAKALMESNPEAFKAEVEKSLIRHINAVDKLAAKGMRFWDYGNAFLLEAGRAGAQVFKEPGVFKYPSYVQDIMGDIFSLGFGPFRWICTSGDHNDLLKTDEIAKQVIEELMAENASSLHHSDLKAQQQYQDNHLWISKCDDHKLVVGSEARILYCNAEGRSRIAVRLNEAITRGEISCTHHAQSRPPRRLRNRLPMARNLQHYRWISVLRGYGCAKLRLVIPSEALLLCLFITEVVLVGVRLSTVGFLLLLDGSADATRRAKSMLHWDVNNGVSRRSWSGNEYAKHQIEHAMKIEPQLTVTLPESVNDGLLENLF
ncbi:urocanate hydratase [Obelidium mucronatum]|nr:urocanate hydratase [Obelidium mucronatum]